MTLSFPASRPFDLRVLALPADLRVLVLAPHPDDFDAIGVTLRYLRGRGHPVSVAVMRTGSGVEDTFCTPPTPEAKAAVRDEEQRRSCRFFGLADEALTLLDMEQDADEQPVHTPRNVALVTDLLREANPRLVFIPHGHDTNSGHRAVRGMLAQALQAAGLPAWTFLNRDPKTLGMRYDTYVAFDEADAGWKARLLRFHASQQQRNLNTRGHGFDVRILDSNRRTARELGLAEPYAEVFELQQKA